MDMGIKSIKVDIKKRIFQFYSKYRSTNFSCKESFGLKSLKVFVCTGRSSDKNNGGNVGYLLWKVNWFSEGKLVPPKSYILSGHVR